MSRPKKPTTNEPAKGGKPKKNRSIVHPERTEADGTRGRLKGKLSDTQRQALISSLQGGVGRDLACKQLGIPWLVFDRTYKDPKEAEFKKDVNSAERSAFQTLEVFGQTFATEDSGFLLKWLDRRHQSIERSRYWENQKAAQDQAAADAKAERETRERIAAMKAGVGLKAIEAYVDEKKVNKKLKHVKTETINDMLDFVNRIDGDVSGASGGDEADS